MPAVEAHSSKAWRSSASSDSRNRPRSCSSISGSCLKNFWMYSFAARSAASSSSSVGFSFSSRSANCGQSARWKAKPWRVTNIGPPPAMRLLPPRDRLEPLRQIELLEEGTDRARKVLHDLPSIEDLRRGIGLPYHLDRLGREVGDRTRLQQPQLALRERPLDVLGQAVVERLDLDRGRGELFESCPRLSDERWRSSSATSSVRVPCSPSETICCSLGPIVVSFDSEGLSVDDIAVGCDVTADHRLSEAEAGFDDQLRALAGGGVGGEQNARDLRRHHDLGHDRHRHRSLVDAVLMAIGDRLRGPQRRPAVLHRRNHGVGSANVEVGLLLSGERQIGEVLRVRRRADRQSRVVIREPCVGLGDLGHQLLRELGLGEELPNALRRFWNETSTVLEVGFRELEDPRLQVALRDELAVGSQSSPGNRRAPRSLPSPWRARDRPLPPTSSRESSVGIRWVRRMFVVVVLMFLCLSPRSRFGSSSRRRRSCTFTPRIDPA